MPFHPMFSFLGIQEKSIFFLQVSLPPTQINTLGLRSTHLSIHPPLHTHTTKKQIPNSIWGSVEDIFFPVLPPCFPPCTSSLPPIWVSARIVCVCVCVCTRAHVRVCACVLEVFLGAAIFLLLLLNRSGEQLGSLGSCPSILPHSVNISF